MALEPARDANRRPQFMHHRETDTEQGKAPSEGFPEHEAIAPVDPPADDDPPGSATVPDGRDGGTAPVSARPVARWWADLPARSAEVARSLRAALAPRLDRAVAAVADVPPGAAAAGAIGIAAVALALLAGDGDAEFPGPSFEAGMLSRLPPSQAADAAENPVLHAPDALVERLVEDPAFNPQPRVDGPAPRRSASAAFPPGEERRSAASPDHTAPATDSAAGDGSKDAVAVLAAAVPPPADPALRLLERLRARVTSTPAEGTPATAATPPVLSQAKAAAARAEPGFAVQLLAVGRREQAAEGWTRLQRDNADLLGRLQPIIVEPERKVSTLFRLRAGPMTSANEAQALCASLARRAVDCIVVHGGG